MNTRTLAVIALVLWGVTVAAGAYLFVKGRATPSGDGRTAVLLEPAERDLVLEEMRGLLHSVHGIVAGISRNDVKAVSAAAAAAGMAAAREVPGPLMAKLPLGFKQQGMQTHAAFDTIAVAAREGESTEMLITRLEDQLAGCVACHAAYRIDTGPSPGPVGH